MPPGLQQGFEKPQKATIASLALMEHEASPLPTHEWREQWDTTRQSIILAKETWSEETCHGSNHIHLDKNQSLPLLGRLESSLSLQKH